MVDQEFESRQTGSENVLLITNYTNTTCSHNNLIFPDLAHRLPLQQIGPLLPPENAHHLFSVAPLSSSAFITM